MTATDLFADFNALVSAATHTEDMRLRALYLAQARATLTPIDARMVNAKLTLAAVEAELARVAGITEP